MNPDKGAKGKNCNRTDCQEHGATFRHRVSGFYYCPSCAFRINDANRRDCRELYGCDDLCERDMEAEAIFRADFRQKATPKP